MKTWTSLALLVLVCMGGMAQEIPLRGNVVVQNSLYRNGELAYVSGAQISAPKAGMQRTGDKGEFTLIFVGKEAGKPADLRCEHPDFELVDSVELAQVKVGDRMPVRITVAKAGHLAQAQAEYNRINLNVLYAHRDALIKQLRGTLEEQAVAMKQMEQDFGVKLQDRFQAEELLEVRAKALEARLPEFSLKMAKLNLDFADKLLVEAFQYFEQGDLVQALKVLNDSVLDVSSQVAISGYQHSILDSLTAAESVKTWREGIRREIEKNQFKADGELLKYQYLAAALAHERTLELLLTLNDGQEDLELALEYAKTSIVYRDGGRYAQALHYVERSLMIRQKTLPPDHPSLTIAHNNLAVIHQDMGDYKKALAAQEKAIALMHLKAPAIDHLTLATSYNNLATIYENLGDYTKALIALEAAISIKKKMLPPNHPSFATSYNNLATIYKLIRDYPKALAAQENAIAIEQKTLPPDHPGSITSYNNLAIIYNDMGNYALALEAQKKAIANCQKLLDVDHPSLGVSFNNLAMIHRSMGEYAQALEAQEKAISIDQKVLPPDHPSLAISYNNLAITYRVMGDHTKALETQEKVISSLEKTLGPYHPKLAMPLGNLALIYEDLGDHRKALLVQEKAISIQNMAIEPDYRSLATSHYNLAMIQGAMGNHIRVAESQEKIITILEKILPTNDPDLATAYNNLAMTYRTLADYNRALVAQEKAIAIQQQIPFPDPLSLAISYNNLAAIYKDIGDYSKALKEQEIAIHIQQKSFTPIHPNLATYYHNLAGIYMGLDESVKALEAQEKTIDIRLKVLAPDHPDLASSFHNLAAIHEHMGEYEKALSAQEKAIFIREKVLVPDHPDLANSYYNLSVIHEDLEDYTQALSAQEKATAIRKTLTSNSSALALSYNHIGLLQFRLGNLDSAIIYKEKAWDIWRIKLPADHQDCVDIIAELGYLYKRKGDQQYGEGNFEEAKANFFQANFYTPNNGTIYNAIGLCHYKLHVYHEAIAAYDRAFAHDPSLKNTYLNNTALAYTKWDKIRKARSRLKQLQALMPDDPLPSRSWSLFHAIQGDLPAALQNLEKAIDLGFNDRQWLDNEDAFDQLRDDPRYQALLARMKP